jgi:hypothetical protein
VGHIHKLTAAQAQHQQLTLPDDHRVGNTRQNRAQDGQPEFTYSFRFGSFAVGGRHLMEVSELAATVERMTPELSPRLRKVGLPEDAVLVV